jgi:putative spermidine/putrescine transport system substrate-binding protein
MNTSRRTVLKAGAAAALLPGYVSRASAQTKTLHVGVYNSAQGKLVQTKVIPQFEKDYNCKVFATEGATLGNIAALRATRDAPKFSVMSMDDIGIPQAKAEDLIVKLDPAKIPNLSKVIRRFVLSDGYGVGLACSSAALFYNPSLTKPITSYAQMYDAQYRKAMLLNTPKYTQSVLMLVVAASLATGKPFKEAQYHIDQAWGKIADLKPNVMTIYDAEAMVLMVAQGQAKIGGIEYSKAIYQHTAKGVPLDMAFPKEGAFTGINAMTLVKGAPEPELGAAFMNRLLEPSVQKMLAENTLSAPVVSGLEFAPDVAKFLAYPERKMEDMGLFTPDWNFIVPRRPGWVEKYNQIFST